MEDADNWLALFRVIIIHMLGIGLRAQKGYGRLMPRSSYYKSIIDMNQNGYNLSIAVELLTALKTGN
jgi:hypothetical protein